VLLLDNLFILAGLGNPGLKLEKTRHNVGFDTIDLIAEHYGIKVNKLKHKALTGEGIIKGERVLLLKPQTYMNLSGESIREAVEWYKIPPENLIIIYDDVDLTLGKIRVRPSGSSGTHNGMKSVIYLLQTDSFPRVRIGIGKAPDGWDLAGYVLSRFPPEERKLVDSAIEAAAEAAVTIIAEGVEKAMSRFNGNGKANGN
jgi:PTH1 family peptidyl-tRNA hydrolase